MNVSVAAPGIYVIVNSDLSRVREEFAEIQRQATALAQKIRDGMKCACSGTDVQKANEKEKSFWENVTSQAAKDAKEFYDKTLPNAFAKTSDAFAAFVTDIFVGSKSFQTAMENLGKSVQKVVNDIIAEFMKMQMRAMLVGLGNLFTGGFTSAQSQGLGAGWYSAGTPEAFGAWHANFAKGGAFSGGSISAFRNSIVASPTLFAFDRQLTAFAKGGIMGEAGPEAIMPLRRGPGGRLGVDASGFGGQGPLVYVNVNNTMADNAEVRIRQSPAANGGVNLDVTFEQKMKSAIASGSMDGVMRGRFGARPQLMGR